MIQTIKQWLYARKARRMKRAEVETDADAHNREVVSYATRALAAEKEVDELRRRNLSLEYTNQSLRKECETVGIDYAHALMRLSRIAELETPRCAHVGKVAAAIARGER